MTIDGMLDRAEAYQRAGQLEDAAAEYRSVLAQSPAHADAHYGLGTIMMQQGAITDASTHLGAAVEALPNVPEFRFNYALVLVKVGDVEGAKHQLLQAARLAGRDPYFLVPICTKMIEFGLAGEAYGCLDATGDTSPKTSVLKAKALGAIGDWRGAAKLLAGLTAQAPDDPSLWFDYSRAAGFLRDYETAIDAFKRYLACGPASGEDYLKLADLYLTARQPTNARLALDKAADGGVDQAEGHLIAAKCARLDGDKDKVAACVDQAIDRRPAFGQAWQLKFENAAPDLLPEIARECTALVGHKQATEWDRVMLGLTAGRAFEKLDRFPDAMDAFKQANEEHKGILARQDNAYDPAATEKETGKIIGHFPVGGSYQQASTSDRRPIFILGMPRSGTTLVEKILTCLDGVEAGGENEALEFIAGQYYWDLAQGRLPAPAGLEAETLAGMADVYWRKTAFEGAIVTDKMPHNFRHVGLICQMFPDARILYMKRDPRDVCLSIYCRPFPEAHKYAVDLDWLGHFYAQSEILKKHWLAQAPSQVREIVYEDLVDSPVEKTQEIAEFCGLEWHPGCLEFHKKTSSSFTFSELQVRKPLNKDGIGRWQSYEAELAPLINSLRKHGGL